MITGNAMVAGVVGYPIKHSLSPMLHNGWIKELGIDAAYIPLLIAPDDFKDAISGLKKSGFRGLNITLPHKETAYQICDELDESALATNAVNTIVFKDSKTYGYNTDCYGFTQGLLRNSEAFNAANKKAIVLGAGGAARAVIHALKEVGYGHITVFNRTGEKAKQIADKFSINYDSLENINNHLGNASLIVNTTSVGLNLDDGVPFDIDMSHLKAEAIAYDLIYNPAKTVFLKLAEERGCRIINGLEMLIFQAIKGFEMWFLKKPQITNDSIKSIIEISG